MYRGAIIGCGSVACQGHIPAWRQASFFQIVAAVDPAPAHRARAQALLPGIRCYEHLETLFDHEELDFVGICTPPAMHDRIILEACERGVHTLCEKPLTFSSTAFPLTSMCRQPCWRHKRRARSSSWPIAWVSVYFEKGEVRSDLSRAVRTCSSTSASMSSANTLLRSSSVSSGGGSSPGTSGTLPVLYPR